jgi:energy-converting hydrogenase Eha subunit A
MPIEKLESLARDPFGPCAPIHTPAIRMQAATLMAAVLHYHDVPDAKLGAIQEAMMAVLEGRGEESWP